MKRKVFILTAILLLTASLVVKADSWRFFKSDVSYVNRVLTKGNSLPKDRKIVNVFPMSDGRTLCVMSSGEPIAISGNGYINTHPTNGFITEYSPFANLSKDREGVDYLQTHDKLLYYNIDEKKWDYRNDISWEPIDHKYLFDLTFDNDNNLVIAGINNNDVPFVAVLNGNNEWIVSCMDVELIDNRHDMVKYTGFSREIPRYSVLHSLTVARDGSILMLNETTSGQRILTVKNGKWEIFSNGTYNALATDHRGNIIYATNKTIGIIDGMTGVTTDLINEGSGNIAVDKDAIWFAPYSTQTSSSLLAGVSVYLKRYDLQNQNINEFSNENTPIDSVVSVINADAKGNVALLANNGIYMIDKPNTFADNGWTTYYSCYSDRHEYLKMNCERMNYYGKYPTSVSWEMETSSINNRYIGVYKPEGVEYYRMDVDKESTFGIGWKNTAPSISLYTSDDTILIGTQNNGLMLYDPQSGKAVDFPGYNIKAYGDNVVDIVEDNNGIIWIGTTDGLIKYDGTSFSFMNKKNSDFKSNKVKCLYVAPDNVLWVGSNDGLFRYDGSQWSAYTKKEGLNSNNIASVTGIGDNVFFTAHGGMSNGSDILFTINAGKLESETLPFRVLKQGVFVDDRNTLWAIGYKDGIFCRKADGTTMTFDASNSPVGTKMTGIVSYEMSGYVHNGKLYVTTEDDHFFQKSAGADMEELEKKYKKLVSTFDKSVIYVLDLN